MVLADGTFDPPHVGHVAYLRAAKALCQGYAITEELVVRIAPDSDIRSKGRKPFQSNTERADCVSAVVICKCYFQQSLAQAVKELRPRLLVKGMDWHGKLPQEVLDACAETKTAIVYVQTPGKTSTERLSA